MDSKDYVSLGDVCRNDLGMQCQYGSRYADPVWNTESAREAGHWYPYFGTGLRITGGSDMYHSMTIHRDDAPVFVSRVQKHLNRHSQ